MDNRRLFLAAVLSLAVLIIWQWLFPAPDRPPATVEPEPSRAVPVPSSGEGERPAPEPPVQVGQVGEGVDEGPAEPQHVEASAESEVVLETAQHLVRLTNRGGQLVSFRLKDRLGSDGEPLELVKERQEGPFPLAFVGSEGGVLPLNDALFTVERSEERGSTSVVFRYRGAYGAAEKHLQFSDGGLFSLRVRVEGEKDWGLLLGPGLRNRPPEELNIRFEHQAACYLVGTDLEEVDATEVEEPLVLPGSGVRWVGLDDSYFLTTLMPETPVRQVLIKPRLLVPPGPEGGQDAKASFIDLPPEDQMTDEEDGFPRVLEMVVVPEGEELRAVGYWGAKEYEALADLPYGLEQTVHWYLSFLARPLLMGLRWIQNHVVGNYGWSIILMTLVIKVVLFPLTHKSYVSMQKLQKLNPRMEAIRAKYRPKLKDKKGRPNLDVQRKMNEEIQGLFRSEGVNPAGGCLPMLLQIPVFIAFYNVLRNAVELWNAPWIFWIQDLSLKDPIYVLPLVMGATQLLQQRLTPMATTNPSQRIIMTTMPFWITFISFGFPSGLVLYWLTNNVLTIIQQGGYNRLKKAGWFGGEEGQKAEPGKNQAKSEKSDRGKSKAESGQ